MRPLRYAINVTLDGCIDHRVGMPDEEQHRHAEEGIARSDALLLGRMTYRLMEEGWRPMAESGVFPEGMPTYMHGFARTIHAVRKVVVSSTLPSVDWNAELVVHPRIVGHGPALFAGLPKPLDLRLVDRQEFRSGKVVLRYVPAGR